MRPYLKPEVKAIIDAIVARLAQDERIQELYNLWYEQREEVLHTYTDTLPERIPLEQNKEFKTIHNAVIQEALKVQAIREQETPAAETEIPAWEWEIPYFREPTPQPPPWDSSVDSDPEDEYVPTPRRQSVCHVGGLYVATASLRLLRELSRLIQNKAEDQQKRQTMDRKLKRQIEEKKQALGIQM